MTSASRATIVANLKTTLSGIALAPDVSTEPRNTSMLRKYPAVDIAWGGGNMNYFISLEVRLIDEIVVRCYAKNRAQLDTLVEQVIDAVLADFQLSQSCVECRPVATDPPWVFTGDDIAMGDIRLRIEYWRDYS